MKTSAWIMVLSLMAGPSQPAGDQTPFQEGMAHYRNGRYEAAVKALSEVAAGPANSEQRAQALYTLASIHAVGGRENESQAALERLAEVESRSPWAIRGRERLAAVAAEKQDWNRAAELTARFLDLYLAWAYAAIDDAVCREAFGQLVEFEKRLNPDADSQQVIAAVRKRYPPTTAAGRVAAFLTRPDAAESAVNLVINPGFDLDARTVALPAGWSYEGSDPKPFDDVDGTMEAGGITRVHNGGYCVGKFTSYGAHYGWLYQQVAAVPGNRYEASAWGFTPVTEDASPGSLRLGIDPRGGTDPKGTTVRWTDPVSSKNDYVKLAFEGPGAILAEGPLMTVFLELKQSRPGPANAMLFDDVSVRPANGVPPAASQPFTGGSQAKRPPRRPTVRSEQDGRRLSDLLAEAQRREEAGDLVAAVKQREQAMPLLAEDEERITQELELVRLNGQIGRFLHMTDAGSRALELIPVYDPRHWPLVEQLLTAYCRDLDRPGAAVSLLQPIVAGLIPGRGHIPAWFELAVIRHDLGDTALADATYEALMRALRNEDSPLRERVIKRRGFCRDYVSPQVGYNRNLEADTLIGRFQTRLSEGKAVEAGEVVADLLSRFPDAFFVREGAAGVGTRIVARELLESMPADKRQACEAACRQTLTQLAAEGHSEALERFLYTHPWRSLEGEAALATGDALLAEGRLARAAARYRQAVATISDEGLKRRAQVKLARVLTLLGEPLPGGMPLDAPVALAGGQVTLGQAVAEWQKDAPPRKPDSAAQTAISGWKHAGLRLQQAPLSLRKWQAGWQPGLRGDGPRATETFVPYVLAGDREQVFVNTSEMLCAVDPVNERLLWTRNATELFIAEIMPPSLKKVPLLNSPKRSYVATSPDSVFFRLNWASRAGNDPRSAVYAARRSDGVLLWSTETLAGIENLRFVTDPAYADGVVAVAAWEASEVPVFHLVGLDARTGEMLWRTHLFSGVMFPAFREHGFFDLPLGAAPPTIHDGFVYFAPGMGVLAKVDLQDGHLAWLQTYPRVCEFGPDRWAGQFVYNRPSSAIVATGKLLMAAPIDQRGVLFFDTHSGRLLRRYEAIDFRCMIGADDRFVFVQQGGEVAAVRVEDATRAWCTTLPAARIVGSPTLSARGICCGTREGLFVLSPQDGRIIARLPSADREAVGTPLDLGDRILAVSESAVHVFAEKVSGGQQWTTPRSPEAAAVTAAIRPPGGIARWALPAPDRGNLHVSAQAPGLLLLQSWETYELRRMDPAPTLLWEFPWLSWPRSTHFDTGLLAMDYAGGRLIGVDMASGKLRWDVFESSMAGERTDGGAIVTGKHVIWFNGNLVRVVQAESGKMLGSRRFQDEAICGFHPTDAGLGVFVGGAAPAAVLIDWQTCQELKRIPLVQPGSQGEHRIDCARSGEWGDPTVLPIVLLDGKTVLFVDLSTGKVESKPLGVEGAAGLVRSGDALGVLGNNGLIAARSLPDFAPLPVTASARWQIRDRVQYCIQGTRAIAHDLATGKQIWQSLAFVGGLRQISLSGRYVLLVVNEGKDETLRSKVVALDRKTGDVAAQAQGLAGPLQVMCQQSESLLASDLGYVYRFSDGQTEAADAVEIRQDRSDPEALAAVRLAANIGAPSVAMSAAGRFAPTIDGDLSDWQAAQWTRLSWPDAWRPDHMLLAPGRVRRPTGTRDLTADLAVSRANRITYVAARVEDDAHDTGSWRPLWRGDSVFLAWRSSENRASLSTGLSLALVDGIPCVETGLLTAPRKATSESDPSNLLSAAAAIEGEIPWLRRWQSGARPLPQVRAAVRRDEGAGLTLYELAIPDTLLGGVAPAGKLLWDFAINDADGEEREGALELGTGLLQLRWPTGLASWPTDAPATRSNAGTRRK